MVVTTLFHIVETERWNAGEDPWIPESLQSEGFIHCSFSWQIAGVINRFFKKPDGLSVVEFLPGKVAARVQLDPGSGGEVDEEGRPELFPHLYGALPRSAVIALHNPRRFLE